MSIPPFPANMYLLHSSMSLLPIWLSLEADGFCFRASFRTAPRYSFTICSFFYALFRSSQYDNPMTTPAAPMPQIPKGIHFLSILEYTYVVSCLNALTSLNTYCIGLVSPIFPRTAVSSCLFFMNKADAIWVCFSVDLLVLGSVSCFIWLSISMGRIRSRKTRSIIVCFFQ